jgi:hypothetical protein
LVRIQYPETPRVPEAGSSTLGKSGPKARTKVVVDGHEVNIPQLELWSIIWDALRSNYALIGLGGEYVLRLVVIGVKKSM